MASRETPSASARNEVGPRDMGIRRKKRNKEYVEKKEGRRVGGEGGGNKKGKS